VREAMAMHICAAFVTMSGRVDDFTPKAIAQESVKQADALIDALARDRKEGE
jgi:hypothetical protein